MYDEEWAWPKRKGDSRIYDAKGNDIVLLKPLAENEACTLFSLNNYVPI
jgi:hypothetical protein